MKRIVLLLLLAAFARVAFTQNVKPNFSSVEGRTIFTCEGISLFKVARTEPKLDWTGEQILHAEPFRAAKLIHSEVYSYGSGAFTVASLIELPSGTRGVLVSSLADEDANKTGDSLLAILLGDVSAQRGLPPLRVSVSGFVGKLPKGLGDTVTLKTGMTAFAAECLMGRPNHRNDYGRAGEQWVYGSTILYFDHKGDRVADIQQFD